MKKLSQDYDPTNRPEAMRILEEANAKQWLVTGLIYIEPDNPSLIDIYDLPEEALNRLDESRLRPARETIDQVNEMMF